MRLKLLLILFFSGFVFLDAQIIITSESYSYGISKEKSNQWDMILTDEPELNVLSLYLDLQVMLLINENSVLEFSIQDFEYDERKETLVVEMKSENKENALLTIDKSKKEASLVQYNNNEETVIYLYFIDEYEEES